jgi:integrase/recombinase XerD
MLNLTHDCGLRASEVVRLRAGDIDTEQMIIRIVQSKGRRDRRRRRSGHCRMMR